MILPKLLLSWRAYAVDQSTVLCADITHTHGASQYATLSFLALAIRAVRELEGARVSVVPPRSRVTGAATTDIFTTESHLALAKRVGFDWEWDESACNSTAWDVRMGETVHHGIQFEFMW